MAMPVVGLLVGHALVAKRSASSRAATSSAHRAETQIACPISAQLVGVSEVSCQACSWMTKMYGRAPLIAGKRRYSRTRLPAAEVRDPWVTRMRSMPATVVSTTLEGPRDWPDATVVRGDAVDVVARLKKESEVPLRSHGGLSMNRALMAAGLVDRVQVTLFP